MKSGQFAGSRIREKRLDQGLRQADVAGAVGISASYLNLIEHNKRRIGGKLLAALAQVLDADVTALASGADAIVIEGMLAAAARVDAPVEVGRAEDLASRFPGWAALIASQEMQVDALEGHVQTLTDRITNDPALAVALHNVITAATSIRATAGILVSDDKIDADWQRRFHTNLQDDSRKLANESKALVAYLEKPKEEPEVTRVQSSFEEAETFLEAHPDILTRINADPACDLENLLTANDADGLQGDARLILKQEVSQFATDAAALPFAAFSDAAKDCGGAPDVLAAQFDTDLPIVFRRLSRLYNVPELPPMGLVTCDGAGAILSVKAITGFGLNRRSASCPLWPVFTALQQPGRPVRAEVILPDTNKTRFLCFAVATLKPSVAFDAPSLIASTMLVVADPVTGDVPPIPLGTSCRICPRRGCAARREASVVVGI